MGLLSEKGELQGLFCGVSNSKTGKIHVSVVTPGPKIDKVNCQHLEPVPSDIVFGSPVCIQLFRVEQKFQDFNGSYSVAESARVVSCLKK